MNLRILLVEDDPLWQKIISNALKAFGYVQFASSAKQGIQFLSEQSFDMAFIDLDLEAQLIGQTVVEKCTQLNVYPIVISSNQVNSVVEKSFVYGAQDYLIKTGDLNDLKESIHERIQDYQNKKDKMNLTQKMQQQYLTQDASSIKMLESITYLGPHTQNVLITGPTGSGKKIIAELIAKRIAPNTNMQILNCASLNENTTMSELFGHSKGSFTGAIRDHVGYLEKANNGVLFLDEIHELPLVAQKALLTFLDDGIITPLGSSVSKKLNVKIICAGRETLDHLMAQAKFKDDLYFRLSKNRIHLTGLKDRPQDIPFQLHYFLQQKKRKSTPIIVKDNVFQKMLDYSWPGNTRELMTLVDQWIHHHKRLIKLEDLPSHILNANSTQSPALDLEEKGLVEYLKQMRSNIIINTLNHSNSDAEAAKKLKISKAAISSFKKQMKRTEHGYQ